MKYFAILKDSFREALDSKVLYVMLSLSTAVILVVATFSFTPLSAQKTMQQFFLEDFTLPDGKKEKLSVMFLALNNQELRELNLDDEDGIPKALAEDGVYKRLSLLHDFELEKVELVKGDADAPESDYALTIAEKFRRVARDADEAKMLEKGGERVRTIFDRAEKLGFIRVGEVSSNVHWPAGAQLGKVTYRVVVHGTPTTFRIWTHSASLFFGALPMPLAPPAPLGYQLYVLTRVVVLFGSWIAIIVGVIITSFFIPNMLGKGTIDMLLVKPTQRWALLVYKYFGGLTFIFLNTAYGIIGTWLVVGLRTGIWPNGSLLLILTVTFFFAILYAISTFVGVVTRSTIASIMLTLLAWAAFFAVGAGHDKINALAKDEKIKERMGVELPSSRWGNSPLSSGIHILQTVTPRTEELNHLNDQIVYCDLMTGNVADMLKLDIARRNWWESVGVSAAWIAFFLGLACLCFMYKDY